MPLELALSIGGAAICPPGSGVLPRVLSDFEFVWIIAGEAIWSCNDDDHRAPPDTVILSQPGTKDAYRWDPARPTHVAYFHFEAVDGLDLLPPVDRWPRRRQVSAHDVIPPLFRQIAWLSEEQPPRWHGIAHSAACHLLTSFVTDTHDASSVARSLYSPVIERTLVHVKDEWDAAGVQRNISVEELCHAAAVSPRHLSRLFRETFGYGPVETLRLARLEIAASLLLGTDLSLAGIANMTGFANAFHLSRAFKAARGVPPRTFREHNRSLAAPPQLAEIRRLVGRLMPRPLG